MAVLQSTELCHCANDGLADTCLRYCFSSIPCHNPEIHKKESGSLQSPWVCATWQLFLSSALGTRITGSDRFSGHPHHVACISHQSTNPNSSSMTPMNPLPEGSSLSFLGGQALRLLWRLSDCRMAAGKSLLYVSYSF